MLLHDFVLYHVKECASGHVYVKKSLLLFSNILITMFYWKHDIDFL